MRSYIAKSICIISLPIVSGCASIPSLPNDQQFPVGEILRYSACSMRRAYKYLDESGRFPNFKAKEYAITIELQPKVDTEITERVGLTGKNSLKAKHFYSWAIGAATGGGAPGAGLDTTGHQDGAVYYIINSSALIGDDSKRRIDCENWSSSEPLLIENLQVEAWLLRTAAVTNGPVGPFSVDKHTFQTEITIQWDAAGAFTYNFPKGTEFATTSGRKKTDEILSITVLHQEAKAVKNLVTLPTGARFGTGGRFTSEAVAISPDTRTRLDLLQLQQSLQNLRINNLQ